MTQSDAALAAHLPRTHRRTVLVLGDVMLDRYVMGEVNRISPEAPIPVLHAQSRRSVLGGAGNVAQNVAALGGRALLAGLVGKDDAGEEVQHLLLPPSPPAGAPPQAPRGGVAARLVRTSERPTTVKTRFVSGAHQLLRLDEEAVHPAPPELEERVLEVFAHALQDAESVVLSDYAKGLLTDRVLERAIALAREAGIPVVVDPKRTDCTAYAGASVLTPNALELSRATGLPTATDAEVESAGAALLARASCDALLVTRSEKGMSLLRPDEKVLHIPTRAREVADVSGAGDTVIATLALMLASGVPLAEAAALANAAAGVAVAKPGTATVSHDELAAALHERAQESLDEKIVSREAAAGRVAAWKAEGLRVGFTNGCFDLIHPGHAHLLARARAACDRLVVALNSDASVQRLKGPSRPVQNEQARATVMASMAPADLVVIFEEDTPEELIRLLLPDLLFKGADYRREEVVGGDIVEAHGGRVELIPLDAGQSTTATIRRIGLGKASTTDLA